MMKKNIKILSRNSSLAKLQVKEVMSDFPGIDFELIEIKTIGDKNKDVSLIENQINDFFTREIDHALLNNEGDIAIHSAKDLPFPISEGLRILAVTKAFDKTDSLVSRNNTKLVDLKEGAKVGTSSRQRKEQLLKIRPDLKIACIRGTIEERLQLLDKKNIDALIVATCALRRLGLEARIAETLPFETHPLQGQLAVVGRTDNVYLHEILKKIDIRQNFGKVSIIGFGPGDPEYLTIKGKKALKKADIIFYDDLIDKNFLVELSSEKVFVGKRKGNHSKEQEEINRLLYNAAISGKRVVRLKGGDTSIFGRLGEELQFLKERLIDVEIIPGITAASAASALAGTSLTQRGVSRSVALCSGHNINDIKIPDAETLVFYMGASNLYQLCQKLISTGLQKNTPIAIISNASMADQKCNIKTLGEITQQHKAITPAIIIVGKIINKDFIYHWLNQKPKVLVTGTSDDKYEKYGQVIHTPLISIKPVNVDKNVMDTIHTYDYLIFTSKFSVKYFFTNLLSGQKDARYLNEIKIVSIGDATSAKLKNYGIIPDIQPVDESSEGIINYFSVNKISHNKISHNKILIPRSNLGLEILPEGLRKLGYHVKTYTIYNNTMAENITKVDLSSFNYVTFSSPSCADYFHKIYGKIPAHIKPIIKGKETKKRMLELNIIS